MKTRRRRILRHFFFGFALVYFVSVLPMMLAHIRIRRGQLKMCPESLGTMNDVTSCPNSVESWNNRSKEKSCASVKQNCGDNFIYHCLINEWENRTLEVCAVETNIIGYVCAEFNIGGTVIVEHYGLSCQDFLKPCPFSYKSSEAYKYPACFDAVKNNNSVLISTTESPVQEYSTNAQLYSGTISPSFRSNPQLGGFIIVISNAIICLIIFVIVAKKRHSCGVKADDEPYIKICGGRSGQIPLSDQSRTLITCTTQPPKENNSTEGAPTDCDQCITEYKADIGNMF